MTSTEGRAKALEVAISQIEKQFGKGSIMRLGDHIERPGKLQVFDFSLDACRDKFYQCGFKGRLAFGEVAFACNGK